MWSFTFETTHVDFGCYDRNNYRQDSHILFSISDVKRAKFSGTGMPGHSTLWQGQNGQCPFKIFLAQALTIGQRALNVGGNVANTEHNFYKATF